MIQRLMTAEEFADQRCELPDAGQWAELVRGVPVLREPPDLDHGTIVLNFSKAVGEYVQNTQRGYACFDLGLHVETRPDSVLFPAVSYFLDGPRFAHADEDYTNAVPPIVVDLLTTSDRRRNVQERVTLFLQHKVQVLWLVDPEPRVAYEITQSRQSPRRLTEFESLACENLLPEFAIKVGELFRVPDWAK